MPVPPKKPSKPETVLIYSGENPELEPTGVPNTYREIEGTGAAIRRIEVLKTPQGFVTSGHTVDMQIAPWHVDTAKKALDEKGINYAVEQKPIRGYPIALEIKDTVNVPALANTILNAIADATGLKERYTAELDMINKGGLTEKYLSDPAIKKQIEAENKAAEQEKQKQAEKEKPANRFTALDALSKVTGLEFKTTYVRSEGSYVAEVGSLKNANRLVEALTHRPGGLPGVPGKSQTGLEKEDINISVRGPNAFVYIPESAVTNEVIRNVQTLPISQERSKQTAAAITANGPSGVSGPVRF